MGQRSHAKGDFAQGEITSRMKLKGGVEVAQVKREMGERPAKEGTKL